MHHADVLLIALSFGYTGLQLLSQIIIADMTTLRWRGLSSSLLSVPFIINAFVAAEIAQGILPNWRWGYGMFAILVRRRRSVMPSDRASANSRSPLGS